MQIPFSFSYFPLHFLPNPLSGMIFSLAILRHPEVFLWHPYGILHGFSAIRSFWCANSLRIVAILCPRVPPFIILKGGKARKTMPSRLLHERSCHLEFCNFTGRGFSRTLLRTAFLELEFAYENVAFAHENAADAGKTMEDAIRMPQKYLRMPEDAKRKYHARERILQEMQREIWKRERNLQRFSTVFYLKKFPCAAQGCLVRRKVCAACADPCAEPYAEPYAGRLMRRLMRAYAMVNW